MSPQCIIIFHMISMNEYCRSIFGEKVYKLSLDAGFSCPNRDGSLGTGGCIFCSGAGSGDFAGSSRLSIDRQIESEKARLASKFRGERYIAYFQAFTNTYAPAEKLKELFFPVALRDDIAAISIATRPDCLPPETLEMLAELNRIKPVWVELGLQSIHEKTAEYIRRGYPLPVFDRALEELSSIGLHTIVHVILGLPGEDRQMMLETVKYVAESGAKGIKLQLLHVLEGTDLADEYRSGKFSVMDMDEYVELVADCVALLPPGMVVHRLTGDGAKKDLIAPLWSGDKKRVINAVNTALRKRKLI